MLFLLLWRRWVYNKRQRKEENEMRQKKKSLAVLSYPVFTAGCCCWRVRMEYDESLERNTLCIVHIIYVKNFVVEQNIYWEEIVVAHVSRAFILERGSHLLHLRYTRQRECVCLLGQNFYCRRIYINRGTSAIYIVAVIYLKICEKHLRHSYIWGGRGLKCTLRASRCWAKFFFFQRIYFYNSTCLRPFLMNVFFSFSFSAKEKDSHHAHVYNIFSTYIQFFCLFVVDYINK